MLSAMIKLKEWSAALAAVLVFAKTSAAQEFLNEQPESNSDPWSELDTSPLRTWRPRNPRPPRLGVCTQLFKNIPARVSGMAG